MTGNVGDGANRLYYQVDGPDTAPAVLLVNPLGATLDIWEPQVAHWCATFRLIRYDTRGHGRSGVPAGDYTLDDLGGDAVRVLDAVGLPSAHVCGVSLGGLTALWLAIHRPDRVRSIVASNTAARIGTVERWQERIKMVRAQGMDPVAAAAMGVWFTERFRSEHPQVVARCRAMIAAASPEGYMACCAALQVGDVSDLLGQIRARVLVIAGAEDTSTPPSDADVILSRIGHARLATLPGAHITNIECAPAFSQKVAESFLVSEGEAARRRVLGDAHVDRAILNATAFTEEFQAFITEHVWGAVWTRPGLDERTRRVLVLGTLIALGRWEEFAMHVRAAVQEGGMTAAEIKEIVLQQAAYCGVPAAHRALGIAAEVLDL